MGSRFLQGDSSDLVVLQEGTFILNVASARIQDLTPGTVLRSNTDKELVSTQIEQTDLNFSVLSNPNTSNLISDGLEVTTGNVLKTNTIQATSAPTGVIQCPGGLTAVGAVSSAVSIAPIVAVSTLQEKDGNTNILLDQCGLDLQNGGDLVGVNEIQSLGVKTDSVGTISGTGPVVFSNDVALGTNGLTASSVTTAALGNVGGMIDVLDNIDFQNNAMFNLRTITGNGVDSVQILNAGQGVEALCDRIRLQSITNLELSAGASDISAESNVVMNLNNITGVSEVSTSTLSCSILQSNSGVNINCLGSNFIGASGYRGQILSINEIDDLSSNGIEVTSEFKMNDNSISSVDNLSVTSINSITPVGGLYSGISDGSVISTALFTDLLPTTSVGGLNVPANGFKVGDAYHLVCAGIFPTESKNDEIEVQLSAVSGSPVVLGTVLLALENADAVPSNFEIEADFVVRSIGVSGQISTSFDFTFNKSITKDFKGTRSTSLATINTTLSQTLVLNARIIGSSGSSVKSTLAYLRKQY